jgi:hypothetical protein
MARNVTAQSRRVHPVSRLDEHCVEARCEQLEGLRIAAGRSLVLDPLEYLLPMDRDVFWSIDPDTNV